MIPLVIVIAMFALPFIIMLKRKTNTLLVFLSLCLGFLLATFIATDFADVITAVTRGNMLSTTQWIQVALVSLPFLLAIIFTKGKGTPGGGFVALLMAIISSGLAVLLITGYLPSGLRAEFEALAFWRELDNAMTALLIAGGAVALLSLRHHHGSPEKTGKKGKH